MKARLLFAVAILLASRRAHAESEAPVAPEPAPPDVGLSASASYGVTNSQLAQIVQGVELRAMAMPTRFADLGLVAGFEEGVVDALVGESLVDGSFAEHHVRDHGFTDARLGFSASWGAPWRTRRWGFGLELGASEGLAGSSRYGGPYGGAQLRFAFCDCARLRPFVAWSGRAIPWHYHRETVLSTTLDLGLALRL